MVRYNNSESNASYLLWLQSLTSPFTGAGCGVSGPLLQPYQVLFGQLAPSPAPASPATQQAIQQGGYGLMFWGTLDAALASAAQWNPGPSTSTTTTPSRTTIPSRMGATRRGSVGNVMAPAFRTGAPSAGSTSSCSKASSCLSTTEGKVLLALTIAFGVALIGVSLGYIKYRRVR